MNFPERQPFEILCVVACGDRKSTRLNSSHTVISYAVFCSAPHPHLHSFPTRALPILHFPVGLTELSPSHVFSSVNGNHACWFAGLHCALSAYLQTSMA